MTIDPDKLYYLQDKRQYVGNSVLWWAKDAAGYVCDIRKAHVFKGSEIEKGRDTDIPLEKDLIDGIVSHHIDAQHLPKREIKEAIKR